MPRLCCLLLFLGLPSANADLVIYERVDCAPEFKLYPPTEGQLRAAANKNMNGSIWKIRSEVSGCLRDTYTGKKTAGGVTIYAISKPKPLSAHFCVFNSFSSRVVITDKHPRYLEKEHLLAIAPAPCSRVTANYFVTLPKEMNDKELAALGRVLEELISLVREGSESIEYDNDATREQIKHVSADDIWMIGGLRKSRADLQYQELFVKLNPKSSRGQLDGIVSAKITLRDWEIVGVVVSNAHESDLE